MKFNGKVKSSREIKRQRERGKVGRREEEFFFFFKNRKKKCFKKRKEDVENKWMMWPLM